MCQYDTNKISVSLHIPNLKPWKGGGAETRYPIVGLSWTLLSLNCQGPLELTEEEKQE